MQSLQYVVTIRWTSFNVDEPMWFTWQSSWMLAILSTKATVLHWSIRNFSRLSVNSDNKRNYQDYWIHTYLSLKVELDSFKQGRGVRQVGEHPSQMHVVLPESFAHVLDWSLWRPDNISFFLVIASLTYLNTAINSARYFSNTASLFSNSSILELY